MAEDRPLFSQVPIPTYEEAVSASPQPSQYHLGPAEPSDDAERQAFLGAGPARRRDGYRPPTVESRTSEDTLDGILSGGSDEGDDEEREDAALRRDIEEMDMEVDGVTQARGGRAPRSRFGKRMGWLGTTLLDIRLPRVAMPSMEWLTQRMPRWSLTIPDRYRPGWQIIARLFGLFVVIGLLYALIVLEIIPGARGDFPYDPELIRGFAQGNIDEGMIRDNLKHITSYAHIAGSEGDLYLARWIESAFRAGQMDEVETKEYEVYLNYPTEKGRKVAIVEPKERRWQAKLEEGNAYEHPTAQQENTWVFHGLSKTGKVQGRLVYAHYGTRKDFELLAENFIDIKGAIVLVRCHSTESDHGLAVKAAEDRGAKGVLTFVDPREDGTARGEVWPKGRWRPADGVQRGSASLMNWVLGDVLSPGWASIPGARRAKKDKNPGLVGIPSLPISWQDAEPLIKALKGHGIPAPDKWREGNPSAEYWTGGKDSVVVLLQNEQFEDERQPIWNVLGMIAGAEQRHKRIIVGNHRDSWCFGAGDPGSGTAVMLEVVRVLGLLRQKGWRPMRSIQFASWDAKEYNMIGSTEFVEDNLQKMRDEAVAYVNVDVGVVGSDFYAAASPALKLALTRALKRIGDPTRNQTLFDIWEKEQKLHGPRSDSDSAAFQCIAGTSSIDLGFRGPGYPYHSCYETFEWMDKFGDPGFQYHKALAEVWVLLILELSQEPLVPLDLQEYAKSLKSYVEHTVFYAKAQGAQLGARDALRKFDAQPLFDAVEKVRKGAEDFHRWDDAWYGTVLANSGFESTGMTLQRHWHNGRLSDFETNLLDIPRSRREEKDQHGIPGREQFKHVVFGPQLWSSPSSGEAYFPAIRDAIDRGDWKLAQEQVVKAARIITRAAEELRH